MATLYISEYPGLPVQTMQVAVEPAITDQTVSLSSSSASSSAFNGATTLVRLVTDTACFIVFGPGSLTATTSNKLLPANIPEYFEVRAGQKVAARTP